jgi:hypothetical protein
MVMARIDYNINDFNRIKYGIEDMPLALDKFNWGASVFPRLFSRAMNIPDNVYKYYSYNEKTHDERDGWTFGKYANKLAWQYRTDFSIEKITKRLTYWNIFGFWFEALILTSTILITIFLYYFLSRVDSIFSN